MNYLILLGILNLILLSRLRLMFRDEGARRKDIWIMGGVPLLIMPFLQISAAWFGLLVYLLIYPMLIYRAEKVVPKLNRNRLLILLLHMVILALFCSPLLQLRPNQFMANSIRFLGEVIFAGTPVSRGQIMSVQVFIFGLLMVINEMNILLRYVLNLLQLEPLAEETREVDEGEYNTGRVIGLLERVFVFLFVLAGQYTAIGFILAAKGVARFKDFGSRTFAEYVLIGTLLSTLLAFTVGYFVILLI